MPEILMNWRLPQLHNMRIKFKLKMSTKFHNQIFESIESTITVEKGNSSIYIINMWTKLIMFYARSGTNLNFLLAYNLKNNNKSNSSFYLPE